MFKVQNTKQISTTSLASLIVFFYHFKICVKVWRTKMEGADTRSTSINVACPFQIQVTGIVIVT